jgi:hypothetical protein
MGRHKKAALRNSFPHGLRSSIPAAVLALATKIGAIDDVKGRSHANGRRHRLVTAIQHGRGADPFG